MNKGLYNGYYKNIPYLVASTKLTKGISLGIKKHSLTISKTWAQKIAYDYVYIRNSHINTPSEQLLIYDYIVSKLTNEDYWKNNFGNKTVADWFYFFRFNSTTSARVNFKTGAIFRWDIDGTIYYQNDVPVQSKGTGNGYIILSATDGFEGWGFANLAACTLTGSLPNFKSSGILTTQFQNNLITGKLLLSINSLYTSMQVQTNDFTELVTLPSPATTIYNAASNNLTTNKIDEFLYRLNSERQLIPPSANLTLNLSGVGMGSPTGGALNTDLVSLLAVFTTVGRVFNFTIN